MPAKSKAQQRAAGADLARVRKGEEPRTFKGVSAAELARIAETPRKGLPARKSPKKR
jgi:hypothetical protein